MDILQGGGTGAKTAINAWRKGTFKVHALTWRIVANYATGAAKRGTPQSSAATCRCASSAERWVWQRRTESAVLLVKHQKRAPDSVEAVQPHLPKGWKWRRSPSPQYAVGPHTPLVWEPPSLYGWEEGKIRTRQWRSRRFRHRHNLQRSKGFQG